MMRSLLAPAHKLLGRLDFTLSFAIVCALTVLPAVVALAARDALPPTSLALVVGALSALALYALVALRTFASADITAIVRIVDRLASGELIGDVKADSAATADGNRLWAAVVRMNRTLAGIVKQVRTSVESVVVGADGLAHGNAQLTERTQEQAASLEETASGVEQLASSARQNAGHCERARTLATSSCDAASRSEARMRDAAQTMQAIESSAQRVGEILSVVEGIAFQTNILALNAAVEAAHAGHRGNGFAVVAAEVRELARRCAEAAKDIKTLNAEAAANVASGQQLVGAARDAASEAAAGASGVVKVLAEIALATREQSSALDEISRAVAQIDMTTQQTAASVEEAATAAEAFREEARQLSQVVDRFKTDRNDDRGRVIALVKDAVEHVRRVGARRACADFNDADGGFVRGEDYVFALASDGTQLAYAPDPSIVGRNNVDQPDAGGKIVGREILAMAQGPGFGWVDYLFANPRTGQVEPKSVYVESVEGIVVGCGIYRRDAMVPAPVRAVPRPLPARARPVRLASV
jgi:methyl-accepting chemotaxis protein